MDKGSLTKSHVNWHSNLGTWAGEMVKTRKELRVGRSWNLGSGTRWERADSMLMLLAFVSVIILPWSSIYMYILIYIYMPRRWCKSPKLLHMISLQKKAWLAAWLCYCISLWSIYQKNNINILRDLTRTAMNYEVVEQDSVGIADSDQLCFQKQFNKIIIVACDLKQPGQH